MDENGAARLRAGVRARARSRRASGAAMLPLALDIVLRLTGRGRAVGRLLELPSRTGEGVELVGFPADTLAELRAQIELGKLFDPAELERPGISSGDALAGALAALGLDDPKLLPLPIRLEGRVVGGIWIFSDGRPFDDDERQRAELVAEQAELALINAERFLQAREKAFIDDVTRSTTRATCSRRSTAR
jgi:hypothetical protein